MDGDEMEMTREELKKWIREQVKQNELILGMLEKCSLLQSLLHKKEKQVTDLLRLSASVAACEAVVKNQYSLLGWEYMEIDSDDDDDHDGNPSSQNFGRTETQVPRSPASNGLTPLLPKHGDTRKPCRDKARKIHINLKRQPVVVLTRLSPSQIRSFCLPLPPSHDREEESSRNSGSDMLWEPDDATGDTASSSYNSGSNKRRKIEQKNEEAEKSSAKPQASTNTCAKTKKVKHACSKGGTAKTSTPRANENTEAKSNTRRTLTAKTNGATSESTVRSHSESSNEATRTEDPTRGEIVVNMDVLARSRSIGWEQGKVLEIVRKEDGRFKYKINFEGKGRSLVSGHHIAFACMAELEQLSVGARVVVNCKGEKAQYCTGIVAEVPSRRNRMRFLVFMDDHTPIYVTLPFLHLVCKPLPDPLDDIVDESHKNFMKEYIKAWPYPPQTQFKVGQTISAELDGVQQKCEVEAVDCSLIKVIFQKDLREDWIYRGSLRLEHNTHRREHLESKKDEGRRIVNTPMGP